MNTIDHKPLMDTDRAELRPRIAQAYRRFDRLIRSADPLARVPRSEWTVQQTVAHVVTVAQRYQAVIEGRDFRRATTPSEVPLINQEELDAAMAPIAELAENLDTLIPVMDAWFDGLAADYSAEFHCGVMISRIMAQVNWLGELLFHGQDIARAIGSPWDIAERDMLLVLCGILELAPTWLRADISPTVDLCVALHVRGARRYVLHIHDRSIDVRELEPSDRPDAVMHSPATPVTEMFYGRIGPLAAARKGALVVGGRRPWKALKLQSYFDTA